MYSIFLPIIGLLNANSRGCPYKIMMGPGMSFFSFLEFQRKSIIFISSFENENQYECKIFKISFIIYLNFILFLMNNKKRFFKNPLFLPLKKGFSKKIQFFINKFQNKFQNKYIFVYALNMDSKI